MNIPNNPAARLVEIINKCRGLSKNYTCSQAWSKFFKIPNSDNPILLRKISKVALLPREIKDEIMKLKGYDHNVLLRWYPRGNDALNNMHFQRKWETFLDVYQGDISYGIEVCSELLSNNRPEKTVKIDLVISISQQVEDLIKFVESDNIDTRSKTFILSSLYRLQGSLEDIEIGGVREVEESFNTIIGSVIVNNNLNVKPTDSSSAKKFWVG